MLVMSEHTTPTTPYEQARPPAGPSTRNSLYAGLAAAATAIAMLAELAVVMSLGEAFREELRHGQRLANLGLEAVAMAFPLVAALLGGVWAVRRGRRPVEIWLTAAVAAVVAAAVIVLIVLAIVIASGLLYIFSDPGGPVPIE